MTDAVITSKPVEFVESKLLVVVSKLNRIFLNETELKNLSIPSSGTFKRWVNNEDLINIIEDIQKSKSYIAIIAFRYNYIYICFIILLLSIDWFYRRKIGLN